MTNKEKIFCWVCGSDDFNKFYFKPSSKCIRIFQGKYICRECCQLCSFYSICKEKDHAQWIKGDKK